MLPYLPSGIVTALSALSRIRFRNYVCATLIGKFPSTALEVVVGHDIVNYEKIWRGYQLSLLQPGGGALLRNIDILLSQETGMPVLIAEDALSFVGVGTGKALESLGLLRKVVLSHSKHG